jgi:p-cumate 2,3-dioxygenase beta subunit
VSGANLTRSEAEDFLFREAALLDGWRLTEWADLFTEDGEYLVPSTDQPDADPSASLYLVYDDRHRLQERAKRLLKKQAHAEFPHSRVRRIIGNVMTEPGENGTARVLCSFVVYRSRLGKNDVYPGHSEYDLDVSAKPDIRIKRKKAILDVDALGPQGKSASFCSLPAPFRLAAQRNSHAQSG